MPPCLHICVLVEAYRLSHLEIERLLAFTSVSFAFPDASYEALHYVQTTK